MASGTQRYNIKMFVAILTAGMPKKLKHSHLKQPKRIKLKFVIFFLCIPSHESTNLMTMAQHLMKIEGTSKGATVGVF